MNTTVIIFLNIFIIILIILIILAFSDPLLSLILVTLIGESSKLILCNSVTLSVLYLVNVYNIYYYLCIVSLFL